MIIEPVVSPKMDSEPEVGNSEPTYTSLENMARFMCAQSGEWVDLPVSSGEPMRVAHGYAATDAAPNWHYYMPCAHRN